MDKSNLSEPNETLVLPRPQTDRLTTLPPELLLVVIGLLSRYDQRTFCLLSQLSRQLALTSAFRTLTYSQKLAYQIKRFNEARGDVKAAIRELRLEDGYEGFTRSWDYDSILFPCLRSLPNLHNFQWLDSPRLGSQGFLRLVAALQHCPLEHFTYGGHHTPNQTATAPPRLKSLSVNFHHSQVYDFIRPSFSTLVELAICPRSVMDLLPLRPLGRTLQLFVYKMNGFDPYILDTIPDVFPHLTSLGLIVRRTNQDDLWKKSYDDAIAKNTKLQSLLVSAEGFTFSNCARVGINCKKCGNQRVEATRTLALACTGLIYCRWEHKHARYCFKVRLSRKSSEGNILVRVKGVPVTKPYVPFGSWRHRWISLPSD